MEKCWKQVGAELGQAQLQLELGFTLNKVCCIMLMITNYHCISLSTLSLWTWLLPLTCILACLIASFHACLLTYFPISLSHRRPNCPAITVNPNWPKSYTSHPLDFHRLYLVNFKFMIYLPGWDGSILGSATQSYPCHQKSPSRLSTSYLLTIYGQFQAASLLSLVGGGWWVGGGGNNQT